VPNVQSVTVSHRMRVLRADISHPPTDLQYSRSWLRPGVVKLQPLSNINPFFSTYLNWPTTASSACKQQTACERRFIFNDDHDDDYDDLIYI